MAPSPRQQEVSLLGGRYTFQLLVQLFADRIWVVATCSTPPKAGTVALVTAEIDPTVAPLGSDRLSEGGGGASRHPPASGDAASSTGGTSSSQPGSSEAAEEAAYLESIRPLRSLMGGGGGGSLGAAGAVSVEAEVLVGAREDPLTSVVCQGVGQRFGKVGDVRPLVLTLGLPHPTQDPIPLADRRLFVDSLCDSIIALAVQASAPPPLPPSSTTN